MRHLALISVLAILIAGCGATGPSPSAPASNAVQTALPTSTAIPAVTPSVTPTPASSPKIIAGWPKVSRGGVTMTGRTVTMGDWEGGPPPTDSGPVIRVKITGLAPGEVVSLSGTGRYDRWLGCGPLPSGCAVDFGAWCVPAYAKEAKGRVTISAQATVDASGTARTTMRFAMPETKEACPVAGGDPGWYPLSGEWKARVTEQAHGLRLAPDEYLYGP